MNKKIKSIICLFSAAIIWGFAFVAQCYVDGDKLGTLTFNGVRFLLGSLSLVPIIFIFERDRLSKAKLKKTIFASCLAGAALFIAAGLQQLGISLSHNAGKASFITGLYTVIVPILGCVFLKRKTHLYTWVSALIAAGGLFLICVSDGIAAVDLSDVVLLIGSVFWASHILIVDSYVESVSPLKFSCFQFAVCGILNTVFALIFEDITISGITSATMPILYTGILSVGLAYTCQIIGQKGVEPNSASIMLSTECVFGAIGGALILHETMSAQGYVGCVMIFTGIILSQIKVKEKKMIPNDPAILLSFINTKLRDNYDNLNKLCDDLDISEDFINSRLSEIDYSYNEEKNQFI